VAERFTRLGTNLLIPPLILVIPWTQELIDQLLFGGSWNLPMTPRGPWLGVLTAPFSHGGFGHLLANSLMFLPLSWLVLAKSRRDYLAVWVGVMLSALPVWWFWPTAPNLPAGPAFCCARWPGSAPSSPMTALLTATRPCWMPRISG